MLQTMDCNLGYADAWSQRDRTVSLVDELEREAAAEAWVNEDRGCDDQAETPPRGTPDNVGGHIVGKAQVLERCRENEVTWVQPECLPEGHDDSLLHFLDLLLRRLARVKPCPLGAPEQEKLGSEPEVDCTASYLPAI